MKLGVLALFAVCLLVGTALAQYQYGNYYGGYPSYGGGQSSGGNSWSKSFSECWVISKNRF